MAEVASLVLEERIPAPVLRVGVASLASVVVVQACQAWAVEALASSVEEEVPMASVQTGAAAWSTGVEALQDVRETALAPAGVGHDPSEAAGLETQASAREVAAASADRKLGVQIVGAQGGEQSGAASCREKDLRFREQVLQGRAVPG